MSAPLVVCAREVIVFVVAKQCSGGDVAHHVCLFNCCEVVVVVVVPASYFVCKLHGELPATLSCSFGCRTPH